jgi:2-polyprenyl-3-methyl-5-hydroxy-6-metoxy-1,4-benzoquinol methylase
MGITRDEVAWGYRAILGREPESEQVFSHYMLAKDFSEFRNVLLKSQEFNQNSSFLGIGRHLLVDNVKIETTCSTAELARMSQNIAQEWRKFGETEPHWSVLTGDEFKPDIINENMDMFYRIGEEDISYIISALKRNKIWDGNKINALDFGCGVGRLSLALAPHVRYVTGVDISPGHLVHAKDRSEKSGVNNTKFVSIDTIDSIDDIGNFDLIISLIVLQHNPPPVIVVLIEKLLSRLNSGGVAVIQIPTYIVGQSFSVEEYLSKQQPSMEMNAVPQKVIYEAIDRANAKIVEVREDGYMGSDIGLSHTFVIQRR